jgi:hypothetical protein
MAIESGAVGNSLRDAVSTADADRFVGRAFELDAADDLLRDDTPSRVLHVHGPGGIGKSALLRAVARRGGDQGYLVVPLDTRRGPGDLEGQISRARAVGQDPVLVVIDEIDALGSRLPDVRDHLLDALPASSRIALGGRFELDPSWRADGLDAIVVDLPLAPLDDATARDLLARRGVEAVEHPRIVAWAQGSPLALTVASSGPASFDAPAGAEELEARLTSWLAGDAVLNAPSDLVEVAALAPAVDARLLAAALPSRATRHGMRQLTALPVVEQIGDRAVLHAVLAAAVRARLEATAPERKRILSRRIVEQLASRAQLGDMQALIELSQFISDPRMRQAVSAQPSPSLFPSRPRPGELDAFVASQGFDVGDDWAELDAWFDDAPYALCIRRTDGSISMAAWFTAIDDLAERGPVTASLLVAAEATAVDPARSFAGVVLFADASEHERMEAARLGAGALMLQHRMGDMQAVLIHYPAPDRRPIEAISAIADDITGELPRLVALSDFRPFGAVGFVEQVVLAELGVAEPRASAAALLAEDDDEQRQDKLRALLDQVFSTSEVDQRLRRAIELVHLGPRRSEHERINALHVSRSTWFRLLRQARERVLQADLAPEG